MVRGIGRSKSNEKERGKGNGNEVWSRVEVLYGVARLPAVVRRREPRSRCATGSGPRPVLTEKKRRPVAAAGNSVKRSPSCARGGGGGGASASNTAAAPRRSLDAPAPAGGTLPRTLGAPSPHAAPARLTVPAGGVFRRRAKRFPVTKLLTRYGAAPRPRTELLWPATPLLNAAARGLVFPAPAQARPGDRDIPEWPIRLVVPFPPRPTRTSFARRCPSGSGRIPGSPGIGGAPSLRRAPV
jgi:hypothetical protein